MAKLLTNHTKITFLQMIKNLLSECDEFFLSVSFIKFAGLRLFREELEEALNRGVRGKLITSTYQNFTDTASLDYFYSLTSIYENFECHLEYDNFYQAGYHTKGYIFQIENKMYILVGSTNITKYALEKNIEWNLMSIQDKDSIITVEIENEFTYLWNKTYKLEVDIIEKYKLQHEFAVDKWDMDYIAYQDGKIIPNHMQKRALKEIRRYRDLGIQKALVIAATGSGKTYLAAFDAKDFQARRVLFIVHRDTILKEAMRSFGNVFGTEVTLGLYNSSAQELDRDFIFSTNTMMYKNLEQFRRNDFDYIIIDEVHHAVAETYKKILQYFSPEFLLGLTATPERLDNQSVFELFEKNVPFELRLREALENDLIVPFKYYGIADNYIDYSETNIKELVYQLSDMDHCKFIREQIEKYRPKGKLRAIVFCKDIQHSKMMANNMEKLGYHTTYLSGKNNTFERIKAFKEIQDDRSSLEMIFAVDLLNEGIDIPSLNLTVFLRPTESSTIFIQQLGRGLRKYPNKEYLTVLDFIGNSYSRSVQIALALGTLSRSAIMEKKLLMSLVKEDFESLNLPIEINIDELSKDQILGHIEKTNFNKFEFLKKDYFNFKNYLGLTEPPKHTDYLLKDISPDLMRFIKSKSSTVKTGIGGSYYSFLVNVGEFLPELSEREESFLKYLSNMLPLIRPHEYFIIRSIIENESALKVIEDDIIEKYDNLDRDSFDHAVKYLTNSLNKQKEKNRLEEYFISSNGKINVKDLPIQKEFKEYVMDLLEYGLRRYDEEFGNFIGAFKLYGSYKTEQIKLAMHEPTFMQVQGTIVRDGTVYILASLKKDDKTKADHLYHDAFIDSKRFQWESTTDVTLKNNRGLKLIESKVAHLFVRKMPKEDGITLPYTYFGRGILKNPKEGKKSKPTLLFEIVLENAVPSYMWLDYNIEDEKNN